jgi:hypothetical protein
MAKKVPQPQEGVFVEKPKPDVYLAMLVITTFVLLAAIVVVYLARD